MPEPLDPIAAGVATALKSMRAHTGLSEDRLAKTGLASGTLAGLTTVRQFVGADRTTEQAIAQAVREATEILEPTDSIVADAILRLELHPELLPSSDLYAADLGQRRSVLLNNWRKLHELRSAPWDGDVPSARKLRFAIETQALSALAVALTAAEVDTATGEVVTLTEAANRPLSVTGEPRLERSEEPLLSEEFRKIAAALRNALIKHEGGMGWAQDLRKVSVRPTPLSTSYGLQTIIQLEGYLAADLIPVVEFVRKQAAPGGGYAAETQVAARPEGTATVLDALHLIDGTEPFSAHVASMKRGLGDFERSRPFVLSSVLETSVRSGRDPELTRIVATDLLAARRGYGRQRLWAQKAEESLVQPEPSVAHTARAVRALALAGSTLDEAESLAVRIREAVEEAGAWLAEGQDLKSDDGGEALERKTASGTEVVLVRHFTPAWVIMALVPLGLRASHPAVSSAVQEIWRTYHAGSALWPWKNGDLPVWLTHDAVAALHLAAFAIPVPKGSGVTTSRK